jgi:multiple sugar transport system substrate-binding protein
MARNGTDDDVPFGLIWQGARYEGLITVFLEYLGAFGGAILDDEGQVVVDSDAAVDALTFMCESIGTLVPEATLTWQEEQTRFAFQNGQAVFMRNWPYAFSLVNDASVSPVAGQVAVSPFPTGRGGRATAALGGSALAVNAFSEQPEEAYRLIDFLLQPAQMLERAAVAGQFPTRSALYGTEALNAALTVPGADAAAIIERAVARPVTPVYSELSDLLQVAVHRALTRQQAPRDALRAVAIEMRLLLTRLELPS